MKIIMDEASIKRTLIRMTHEIIERNKGVENIVLVGIKTRGETLAKRIAANIKTIEQVDVPVVGFDIRYWRDDLDKTVDVIDELRTDVQDKTVVLVDDVLFRGRTVRAAMDGVMHHGRPQAIQLAVLVDRGHRELPIRADVVGKNIPTALYEAIKVNLVENDKQEAVILLEA